MLKKVLGNKGGRFIAVGLFNTGLDFVLLGVLVWLGVDKYIANYISTTIAMISSFYMNRTYTFKSEGSAKRREIILFFIVTAFGLWVLQPLVIGAIDFVLGSVITNKFILLGIEKVFATGVSLVWNFVLYSQVVFVKQKTSKIVNTDKESADE